MSSVSIFFGFAIAAIFSQPVLAASTKCTFGSRPAEAFGVHADKSLDYGVDVTDIEGTISLAQVGGNGSDAGTHYILEVDHRLNAAHAQLVAIPNLDIEERADKKYTLSCLDFPSANLSTGMRVRILQGSVSYPAGSGALNDFPLDFCVKTIEVLSGLSCDK